jgi:hypothetical protein
MKMRLVVLIVLPILAASPIAAKTVDVAIEWSSNQKTGAWTNKNTGLTLSKKIAGFQQTRAEPVKKDGGAGFGYSGARGIITLYLDHRLAMGFPPSGDCTSAARDSFLQVMHKSYGKTDSERSFRLRFSSASKRGTGIGTVCHFLSFPQMGGAPAYSEVGVLLIGDFLFQYRGTFIDKAGIADLNRFLSAVGVKKV